MALENKLSRRDLISALGSLSALALFPDYAKAEEPLDLIEAIGRNKWDSLCGDCKANAENSWKNGRLQEGRDNILQMYNDSDAFLKRITESQKQEFYEFNRAYVKAIQSKTKFPSGDVLIGQGGKITQEYHKNFPWIDLENPGYNDRILIYARECLDADTKGRRVNWNYVKNKGREHNFGDLDGPDHIHNKNGVILYRQGNSNIYKSEDGKHIMARD